MAFAPVKLECPMACRPVGPGRIGPNTEGLSVLASASLLMFDAPTKASLHAHQISPPPATFVVARRQPLSTCQAPAASRTAPDASDRATIRDLTATGELSPRSPCERDDDNDTDDMLDDADSDMALDESDDDDRCDVSSDLADGDEHGAMLASFPPQMGIGLDLMELVMARQLQLSPDPSPDTDDPFTCLICSERPLSKAAIGKHMVERHPMTIITAMHEQDLDVMRMHHMCRLNRRPSPSLSAEAMRTIDTIAAIAPAGGSHDAAARASYEPFVQRIVADGPMAWIMAHRFDQARQMHASLVESCKVGGARCQPPPPDREQIPSIANRRAGQHVEGMRAGGRRGAGKLVGETPGRRAVPIGGTPPQ